MTCSIRDRDLDCDCDCDRDITMIMTVTLGNLCATWRFAIRVHLKALWRRDGMVLVCHAYYSCISVFSHACAVNFCACYLAEKQNLQPSCIYCNESHTLWIFSRHAYTCSLHAYTVMRFIQYVCFSLCMFYDMYLCVRVQTCMLFRIV